MAYPAPIFTKQMLNSIMSRPLVPNFIQSDIKCEKFIYAPQGSMVFTAPVLINLTPAQTIFVNISCIKFYPNKIK
jgi:hypothetical protein